MADRSPTARAWIELDRGALRHNVEALRRLLPPGCALMPAVKADAYGHGALLVAGELERLGVRHFCVATAREGAELREGGIRGEILVLGHTPPGQAGLLARCALIQTVPDLAYAQALSAQGAALRVHLKIDTGMHRLGTRWEDAGALAATAALPGLEVTGAYTHLCDPAPSPSGRAHTLAQAEAFRAALAELDAGGCPVPAAHILSSGGLLHYPELGGSFARVGIALYGVLSTGEDEARSPVALRPVLSLKARVAQVRELAAGERAGYGLRFTAPRPTRLAVLTIGYADGLPRCLSEGIGSALLHGRPAPVAGRICMDQTLVDVTGLPPVSPGDTAVLIGRSGGRTISACDLARQAGTISNEILSRLGARLERIVVP